MDFQGNGITVQIEAATQPDQILIDAAREIAEAAEARGLALPFVTGAVAVEGAMQDAEAPIEPVEVPEITPETAERLEALPADYRELVVSRYSEKYVAVDGYIRTGKLPEAYRLPELGTLVERAIAVAPTFEHMQTEGWEPSVDFVPQGLSREQWNGLIKGHELPSGQIMEGNWYGFSAKTIDPTNPEADANLWDVAVTSATERPVLTNVSKDGTHGSNAKKVIKALSEMPSVTDTSSPEAIVAQASPSEEAYNAMQLGRLERGEQPVDAETWTISKENVKVGDVLRSVYRYFGPYSRTVVSNWVNRGNASSSGGVRPSARGKDLVLSPQV